MSFRRKLWNKYGKQLLDAATKTGLDALKTLTKKLTDTAGEFTGNKIVNKIVKPKPASDENSRNDKEIITSREQKKKYWIN